MLRLKNRRFDVAAFVLYVPPFSPGVKGELGVRAARALYKWTSDRIDALPNRCTPIVMVDANSDYEGRRVNRHGQQLQHFLERTGLRSFAPRRWEPTFVGPRGGSGRIDFVLAPRGIERAFAGAWVQRRAARRLQVIPHADHRDHLPVKAVWLGVRDGRRAQSGNEHARPTPLDPDKVAEALHRGTGRVAFLSSLYAELMAVQQQLRALRESPDIDGHWSALNACVRAAAGSAFGTGSRGTARREESAERLDLLRQRAQLRSQQRTRREAEWTSVDYRLGQLTRKLGREARARRRRWQQVREEQLQAAWRQRRFHDCYRLAHLLAGRGLGSRRRRYGHIAGVKPGIAEWAFFFCRCPVRAAGWRRSVSTSKRSGRGGSSRSTRYLLGRLATLVPGRRISSWSVGSCATARAGGPRLLGVCRRRST